MILKTLVITLITAFCTLFFIRTAPAEVVSIWDKVLISDISPLTVLTQLNWLVIVGNPLNDDTFNVVGEMSSNGTGVLVEPLLVD